MLTLMWRVSSALGLFLVVACFASAAEVQEAIPPPAFEIRQTRSDANRPSREHHELYRGPLIDVHVHVLVSKRKGQHAAEPKRILDIIKSSGVELAIVMPTPNEGRRANHEDGVRLRERLVDLGGKRIEQFCGSNYLTYWMHRAYHEGYPKEELLGILQRLSEDLKSDECSGVGEIALYHFEKRPRQHVIEYPPNFEPFLRVVRLVADRGVWLNLHAEPVDPQGKSYEAELFGGMELLFRRNPTLKVILSHTAMTSPYNVRSMLRAYPNLIMDVKIQERHSWWRNLEPIVNPKGELYEDWAQLFEAMAERFMVGTDAKFGRPGFQITRYRNRIQQMRAILGTLNTKAAGLIAYGNARKIFGAKE